jgi:ATP-dependent Clp protease ATP-binding subunit ClpA
MFDRFSEDARKLMSASRQAAQEFGHDYIGTEHMLLGVVASDGTVASAALRKLGVDPALVRAEVTKTVRRGTHEVMGQIPFTPRAKRVLELSLQEAQEAGHRHIGTGHLLLGLLREGEGIAAQVLGRLGVTLDKARPVVMEVMRTATGSRDGPPTRDPAVGEPLRKVIGEACAEAARLGHPTVEPEHVLIAMLEGKGVAARVLRELGATPDGVRRRVGELRAG